MAIAATQSQADPILATAIAGQVTVTDAPSTNFRLADQQGRPVRLTDFRGKAVILTFLDPVCTTDCPVIARELLAADGLLGAERSRVQMVAVNANPDFTATPFLQRFDLQEGLEGIGNWSYLTGPARQLQAVWADYGVDVEPGSGGAMMSHSDVALVIDPAGRIRQIIDTDPGPATGPTKSSFAQIFAHAAEQALHR
jgi:cytochrome oxidase Cu insertion factor (SCO1/SenC/PrrC family)